MKARPCLAPRVWPRSRSHILTRAWLLARDGQGQVLEDWAEPDADQLCEVGRLERRTVNDTDDVAYLWTREAETALDMNAYAAPDPADMN
jgi:hypothetical protein